MSEEKIGMYTAEEIYEELANGFLHHSMVDAMYFKIKDLQQKVEEKDKEIDRLNNIINELDEDIYSLYEDICNSDDTYCYRIPMEIIIDRLDKMSNKITKFNENKLKEEK